MFALYLFRECFGMSLSLHRYFSHKGFRCGRGAQFALWWLGCMACQGPPLCGMACQLATMYFNVAFHTPEGGGSHEADGECHARDIPWDPLSNIFGEAYHAAWHHIHPRAHWRPGVDLPYFLAIKPMLMLGVFQGPNIMHKTKLAVRGFDAKTGEKTDARRRARAGPGERPVDRARREQHPDADAGARWAYPSPQMFWNSLVRKGKVGGASEGDMDTVIAVHNSMNEATPKAWLKQLFGHPKPFDRHDWIVVRGDGAEHCVASVVCPEEAASFQAAAAEDPDKMEAAYGAMDRALDAFQRRRGRRGRRRAEEHAAER
ncbi:holocytochrome-c synthase [Aureococcus anophagefferens]|uniref:Holocytochrome c-type synthase n=1 Tax=Aureococcus anophagefferens TaxID=44056 RepID=A0ABR1G2H5_AURAN